ncbi:hypothetical protein CYMTET_44680 [Cymbomonas tetramitiformis]|uniref:Uncharacterized protein n=1 Tax=Cymbomonas tetramitiformis TaxID=36881 RepID=A0AAE0EZF0_9CHLO|nr:hypothetical protein CYMTET_44680 [Cymbomonas tetramitiformis]
MLHSANNSENLSNTSRFASLRVPLHTETIPNGSLLYAKTVPIVDFDDTDNVIVQTWARYLESQRMVFFKRTCPTNVSTNPVVHFITDSRDMRKSTYSKDSHIVAGLSVNELPSYQLETVRAVFDNASHVRTNDKESERGVPFAYSEGKYGAVMRHEVGSSALRLVDMEDKENLKLLDTIGSIMYESESEAWSPSSEMWKLGGHDSSEWGDGLRKNWYDSEKNEYRRVVVKPTEDQFLKTFCKYVKNTPDLQGNVHGVIYTEDGHESGADKTVCLFNPHQLVLSGKIETGALVIRADHRLSAKYERLGLPKLDEFVERNSDASRVLHDTDETFASALYSHDKSE